MISPVNSLNEAFSEVALRSPWVFWFFPPPIFPRTCRPKYCYIVYCIWTFSALNINITQIRITMFSKVCDNTVIFSCRLIHTWCDNDYLQQLDGICVDQLKIHCSVSECVFMVMKDWCVSRKQRCCLEIYWTYSLLLVVGFFIGFGCNKKNYHYIFFVHVFTALEYDAPCNVVTTTTAQILWMKWWVGALLFSYTCRGGYHGLPSYNCSVCLLFQTEARWHTPANSKWSWSWTFTC